MLPENLVQRVAGTAVLLVRACWAGLLACSPRQLPPHSVTLSQKPPEVTYCRATLHRRHVHITPDTQPLLSVPPPPSLHVPASKKRRRSRRAAAQRSSYAAEGLERGAPVHATHNSLEQRQTATDICRHTATDRRGYSGRQGNQEAVAQQVLEALHARVCLHELLQQLLPATVRSMLPPLARLLLLLICCTTRCETLSTQLRALSSLRAGLLAVLRCCAHSRGVETQQPARSSRVSLSSPARVARGEEKPEETRWDRRCSQRLSHDRPCAVWKKSRARCWRSRVSSTKSTRSRLSQ